MRLDIEAADRLRTVLYRVGYSLWQLQELEGTAAGYVVVRLKAARGVGVQRGATLSAAAGRQPLGKLLGELASANVISGECASRLKALLDDSNWLVHRSALENRDVLADAKKYARLVSRLDELGSRALELNKELAVELERYVVASGVSRVTIDREATRLAKSWGIVESSGRRDGPDHLR